MTGTRRRSRLRSGGGRLSGGAAGGGRDNGAVGRSRLTAILRGSGAKALKGAGHDRLDSHGALVHMTQDDVMAAIDGMIAAGTLRKTEGPYPLVRKL